MGRPSNRTARRAQIVDGLLTVLAERGFTRATIHEIAVAAGLGSGLVHYHFGTKGEILLALVDALIDQFDVRFGQRVALAKTPLGQLDAYVDAHLELDETSDPRIARAWVVIASEAARQPAVQERYAAFTRRRLERLVLILQAWPNLEQPRAVAATLLAAFEGTFGLSAAVPDAMPPGAAAGILRTIARQLVSEPS